MYPGKRTRRGRLSVTSLRSGRCEQIHKAAAQRSSSTSSRSSRRSPAASKVASPRNQAHSEAGLRPPFSPVQNRNRSDGARVPLGSLVAFDALKACASALQRAWARWRGVDERSRIFRLMRLVENHIAVAQRLLGKQRKL